MSDVSTISHQSGTTANAPSVTQADGPFESQVREGMRVDWDVPFRMADGTIVRANIFRPIDQNLRVGTIASSGVYGKDLAYQEGYPGVWEKLTAKHPEVAAGSTNIHQNWEVVDPEKWVRRGFAVVRVDARGSGTSDGYLDPFARQEAIDFAVIIERLSKQPWSNGNVGTTGISYFAITSWGVAAEAPAALKAVAIWEGSCDFYREASYHGGIYNELTGRWYPGQVQRIQRGKKGYKSAVTGRSVTGEDEKTPLELINSRFPLPEEMTRQKFDGALYRERSPVVENIKCAVLSCANWGGQGLHLRGNIEGYLRATDADRYLEIHGLEHWTHFARPTGEGMLMKFFGHYLNDEDNGWVEQPRVQLNIRHPRDEFDLRSEKEWPLARTEWTKLYLTAGGELRDAPGSATTSMSYDPLGSTGLTFSTPPLEQPLEITGPLAAKLFVSSASTDADIFAVVSVFDPEGKEVLFRGTADPHTPVAQGWLRASHRHLDAEKTLPYRPYHTHDRFEPLTPGEVVEFDVEIWPTCIVVPAGHRIVLNIRGKDFDYTENLPGGGGEDYSGTLLTGMKGCGPFTHNDSADRPVGIFGAEVALHFDGDRKPYLLLPVIPHA